MTAGREPSAAGEAAPRGRRSASIATRLLMASAGAAILVVAAFTILLVAVSDLRRALEEEDRARMVVSETLALDRRVTRLQNQIELFISTSDPAHRETARLRLRRVIEQVRKVRALEYSDSGQRARVQRLLGRLGDYRDQHSDPLINREITPAIARQGFYRDTATELARELEASFVAVIGTEGNRARRLSQSADDQAAQAIVLAAVGILASAALFGAFGVYLARSIGRPLRQAADTATRMAGGDLSLRLPPRGPGEVGELTRAFNVMAERLEANRNELQEQNMRLRESEQLKTELVSIVSHEVRTPLASVLGFTSLLLERELDQETRRRYLEIVDTQARRLSGLLDDFLDVQRIEEGRMGLTRELVDMARVLHEQTELFTAQSERHRLRLRLEEQRLDVQGDAGRLGQVVANLLSNAIKYSPDGGVVEIVGDRVDGSVRILVRDEGIGIPPEQQERIFTKFYRGDAAASGITGTGLGLAFARAVVEAHGGHIQFRSRTGRGSEFWIDLPAAGTVS